MPTLLDYNKKIERIFLHTWPKVAAAATDQVLQATPLTEILKKKCLTGETGKTEILERVRNDFQEATDVDVGDTLPSGVKETETFARFRYRKIAAAVQYSEIEASENAGVDFIKKLVDTQTESAMDGASQTIEQRLNAAFTAGVNDDTGKRLQSIATLVPPFASRATGNYGYIPRSESTVVNSVAQNYWQAKYQQWAGDREVNLLSDMRTAYNNASNNSTPPDLIYTSQALHELYEDTAARDSQIVKSSSMQSVDLSFSSLMFKGAPLIWGNYIETAYPGSVDPMLFLCTKFIKWVYNTRLWGQMTRFKDAQLSDIRIAHILWGSTLYTKQPRRHLLLSTAGNANITAGTDRN
jgi:hypothetical protein